MSMEPGSAQWHAEAIRLWEERFRTDPPDPNFCEYWRSAVEPVSGRIWLAPMQEPFAPDRQACTAVCRGFSHDYGEEGNRDLRADEAERLRVLAEIEAAFDGVSREDGVTLHEADVIDHYGGDDERAAARKLDTETRWQDADLKTFGSVLCFLDVKGFRYYIPAYLCWTLRFGETGYEWTNEQVVHQLCVESPDSHGYFRLTAETADRLMAWKRARHDTFRPAEAKAILAFLRFVKDVWWREVSDATLAYWECRAVG